VIVAGSYAVGPGQLVTQLGNRAIRFCLGCKNPVTRTYVLSIATRRRSGIVQHKVQIAMQELAILFEINRH
jgi:hypothetical protein